MCPIILIRFAASLWWWYTGLSVPWQYRMSHEKKTKAASGVEIGTFRFDPQTQELTDQGGRIVHMRKQSIDVLSVLVEAGGKVVEKSTLFGRVWPDVATTDDSLVQCIGDIRRTLGPDVVETFPKRGYRLRQIAPSAPAPRPSSRPPAVLLALVAVLALAVGIGWSFVPRNDADAIMPPVVSSANTLAVLPFVNLNPSDALSFLSDGLSEDISTDLSKVPGLTVISPASSFDYRNAEAGFREIAEDLGVRYLVRGTVREESGLVRINVSLIDTQGASNLWSERFDRQLESVFGLQDEVARHVVDALSLTLARGDAAPQRIEPDAYFMLLRGLEVLRDAAPNALSDARGLFENAVLLDPDYARAHASIALTYGREAAEEDPADEVSKALVERGLEAAVTAIQLDPEIPHAYLAIGLLNLAIREYDNALAAARHALRQDINYADGYALLAEVGLFGADLDEALYAIRRAKLLHPHHTSRYDRVEGHILFHLGQTGPALRLLDGSETPGDITALLAAYGHLQEPAEAQDVFRQSRLTRPELREAVDAAPFRYEDRRERLLDGLRGAGLID